MRIISCLFLFLIVFGSCKSKKNLVSSNAEAVKSISVKKIIKKHTAISFDAKTLDARLKIGYVDAINGKRNRVSFTVTLRIQKDSIIWMKGSKIISAFRVKITPTTFSYYSLIDKKYFEGAFSLLEKMLGTKITYKQVQNLLLGKSILDLKKQKYLSEVAGNLHKLTPKKQHKLYRIFFFFDPNNYRLKKQLLKTYKENKIVQIDYKSYSLLEKQLVPKKIVINASQAENYTKITIDFKSVTLNKQISTPYKIPSSYKPIKL